MKLTRKSIEVLAWLAAVAVLYVLAVGPAVSFSFGTRSHDAVRVIWYPVIALDDTALGPLYSWYLDLWGLHSVGPTGF